MRNKSHLIHPQYRSDIDGLRAIAVLSVLVFHAFPDLLPGGFIGVDVFFVISGYLISKILISSLEHNRFNLIEFYVRRIRRIFPALLLVLVSCFVFGWFFLLADQFAQLGKHIAGGAGFISNILLWKETGYFDASAETKPLLHLWSLGIEEQFYVVWPLLLWLFYRWNIRLFWAALLFGLVSFGANIWLHVSNPTADFYSPFTRFWELVLGGLLAYKHTNQPSNKVAVIVPAASGLTWSSAISCLGISSICLGLAFVSKSVAFPGYWALLPVVGASLLIASGPNALINRHVLSQRPVVFIGLVSFPLYLWHWPLLVFPRIFKGDEPSVSTRLGALLLSLILATLTYYLVERPLRFGRFSHTKTIGLLISMLITGFIGYNTYDRGGLPFRKYHKENFKEDDVSLKKLFASYRYGVCFVEAADTRQEPFKTAECDPPANPSKKTVFLWGDSHAASLYPGLADKNEGRFNLGQYNIGGCPPILNFSNLTSDNECIRLNNLVFNRIRETKPDIVILGGYWSRYNDQETFNSIPDSLFNATIAELKALGVKEIVLVGNLPVFGTNQPAIAEKIVPLGKTRTYNGFDENARVYDKRMSVLAKENHIRFFSPIDTLCNDSGCLISLSAKTPEPLAMDYGHLTDAGSDFLISSLMQEPRVGFQQALTK